MGTNRKQPFGYRMDFGRVIIYPEEAEWVRYIFFQYNQGTSFKGITEAMRCSGILYDCDKSWNKNMVARILGDSRYYGDRGFPEIIDLKTFQSAAEERRKKSTPVLKTEAQVMLRKKCDQQITPYLEHEVLYLLNSLAINPEQIAAPNVPKAHSQRLDTLKSELEELISQLPEDENRAREVLQEIAAEMYADIDPGEYETQRMRRAFQKEEPRNELDANLIAMNISAVLVDSNGKVRIRLKNDQIIERGE